MSKPCCGQTENTGSNKDRIVNPTFISRILAKVFVSDTEKNRRMEICRNCEHFNSTFVQCKLCGCFLEAKTRLQGFHCALDLIGEKPAW